jgi:hypothetical protein
MSFMALILSFVSASALSAVAGRHSSQGRGRSGRGNYPEKCCAIIVAALSLIVAA